MKRPLLNIIDLIFQYTNTAKVPLNFNSLRKIPTWNVFVQFSANKCNNLDSCYFCVCLCCNLILSGSKSPRDDAFSFMLLKL